MAILSSAERWLSRSSRLKGEFNPAVLRSRTATRENALIRSPEVIVHQKLTRESALERLTPALSHRYTLTRTPEDDELYVVRFPGTKVIVRVSPLRDGRTSFQVRADDVWWSPALYVRLVSTRQVARVIRDALGQTT